MTEVLERHAVRVTGAATAPPMLFAHGFGCDQTLWRFVAPAFEPDFRVITFDYVGAGKSDRSAYDPARYSTLDGYARDILEICHALDLSDVVLVGHSVSATVALLAAIAEPSRFSRLILVTPSPRYIDDPPDYRGGFTRAYIDGLMQMMDVNATGWAEFLAPIVMGNPERPDLARDLEGTFCSIDPVMARQFAEVTFYADNRIDLERVVVPSLIIQCTNDAVAPMDVGRYMNERLAGSEMAIINATGHCPHVSHPDETVAAMRSYLERSRLNPQPASV